MEISKTRNGESLLVTVTGRVDTTTAPELDEALKLDGITDLVIDLGGVPYMSSAGLRSMLTAQKAMMAAGGSLKLVKVQSAVKEVFEITGFSDIINIEE